jgi:hypothetical protein
MDPKVAACLLVLTMPIAASGCVAVGLVNWRAPEIRASREDASRDVVANGIESCERPLSNRSDSIPIRLYPCPNTRPEGASIALRREPTVTGL